MLVVTVVYVEFSKGGKITPQRDRNKYSIYSWKTTKMQLNGFDEHFSEIKGRIDTSTNWTQNSS